MMNTEMKQTIVENGDNEILSTCNDNEEQTRDNQQESISVEDLRKSLEAKAEELKKWHIALLEKESRLETVAISLQKDKLILENQEKDAECALKQKIDAEYTNAMAKLQDEQNKSRENFAAELEGKKLDFEKSRQKAISDLSKELETLRNNAQKEIDDARRRQEEELQKRREETEKELEQQRNDNKEAIKKEKDRALQQLEIEKEERTAELTRGENVLSAERERVKGKSDSLENWEKEIADGEEKLKDNQEKLERDKRGLEREKLRIEEANNDLTEAVNQQIDDRIKNFETMIDAKNQELDRLRNQLSYAVRDTELVKSFKEAYGDDPQILQRHIIQLEEEVEKLKKELLNSADKSELDRVNEANRKLNSKLDEVIKENCELNISQRELLSSKVKSETLESENKSLQATCEALKNQLETMNQELIRLSTPEARVADRDARIAA
ncbi:MAG: hypothetical protein PUF50_01860, partial [Erysipelotrichaceae bacterium]|nr:hypothetical protein [Erysipelotrichaceae bacterium]